LHTNTGVLGRNNQVYVRLCNYILVKIVGLHALLRHSIIPKNNFLFLGLFFINFNL
jgi:hypothetical protein